jgi:opacity protein-like surface antigen
MTRPTLSLICALAACAVASAPVAAQRIDSPYRFLDHRQDAGLYAGYVQASAGLAGLGPTPGPLVGGRWAIRVSGPFSAGAEVSYMPTKRVVRDTVFVEADSAFRAIGETDMRLVAIMGNLTFSLTGPRTWHRLRPLLSAGAGAAFDIRSRLPEEAEFEANMRYSYGTSFAGQLGAGVEWFPTDRLSLRGDVSNLLWRVGMPEAFALTEAGRTLGRSRWEGNLALTAGVSIHF